MWVRSDVTSGRNRRWEWRPNARDAEDGKTTSDASGRGARASDAGLIFADVEGAGIIVVLLMRGVFASKADWSERVGEGGGDGFSSWAAVSIASPAGGRR